MVLAGTGAGEASRGTLQLRPPDRSAVRPGRRLDGDLLPGAGRAGRASPIRAVLAPLTALAHEIVRPIGRWVVRRVLVPRLRTDTGGAILGVTNHGADQL